MRARRTAESFRIGSRGETLKDKIKDLLFGMFLFPLHQQAIHAAIKYKDIIHIILLGEFLGLPLLGTYYTLRLIPYLIDEIPEIIDRALKERDVFELMEETDVH